MTLIKGGASHNVAQLVLSYIQRAEMLEAEIKALNTDKSEVFKEARAVGLCVKTLKVLIRRRSKDQDTLQEEDALLELYERAIEGVKANLGNNPDQDMGDLIAEEVLYEQAKALVIQKRKASIAFIRSSLNIGYNAAARIVERLELHQVISRPNTEGARSVLVNALDV